MSEEQLIATPGKFGENDNFMLERELGKGGMGGVYMGRDTMLDRPVAVKVMLRQYGSDAEFVEKFKREAQAAARLIHPNIAQIYSYGISDGMPYIAMELVAGGSLDQIMRNSGAKTDVPRVMKICEQVAQALRCAADQGLVHGDVKPENVLLDANGNAKLVDFGLAAMQKDTDEIWGTPYYIAPEKVKKEPVDYRADMYSLGGTIYHALTGVAPFEGDDATAVVRKRFQGPPAKPSAVRAGLSPQIDALVMKMLALDPADRYPSFEALLEDFKKVMASGLSATQPLTPAQAAQAGAAAGAGQRAATAAGGKRLVLKSRRRMTVKRPADGGEADETDANASAQDVSAGSPRATSLKGVKMRGVPGTEEDEEEEGGAGGKIALVIGGVLAALALVGGGLFWAVKHNASENERKTREIIEGDIDKALASLSSTGKSAVELDERIAGMSAALYKDAENLTKQMASELDGMCPPEMAATLRPAKTKDLLDAERAFLAPVGAPPAPAEAAPAAAAPAAAAPAAAPEAASPEAAAAPAAPAAEKPRFRPPEGDETDPNSPEGQKYLEEKKKFEEEQAAAEAAPAAAETPEQGGEAPADDSPAEPEQAVIPAVLEGIAKTQEMWGKVYEVQAGVFRARARLKKLAADLETASAVGERDEVAQHRLADASRALKSEFESIAGSAEVTELKKLKGSISNTKMISKLHSKISEEKHRIAKEQAAAEKAKADEEKERARREEYAAKVEKETALVKATFEKLKGPGASLVQLDWRSAARQLDFIQDRMTTHEGENELNTAKRRIEMMRFAQNVVMRNIKGFRFARSAKKPLKHLRGATVVDVNEKEITVKLPNSNEKRKIRWPLFYSEYSTNLSEVFTKYVFHGKENGKPVLNNREYSNALLGVALTMQLVFGDDESAAKYEQEMIKTAVKASAEAFEFAKRIFPEMDFSEIESAMEKSNF